MTWNIESVDELMIANQYKINICKLGIRIYTNNHKSVFNALKGTKIYMCPICGYELIIFPGCAKHGAYKKVWCHMQQKHKGAG